MGKLTITLPGQTERKFRELVEAKYGKTRGALSIAVKEAVEMWMKEKEKK